MQKGYAWDLQTRSGALPDKGAQIVVHEFDYKQENEIVYQENGVTIRSCVSGDLKMFFSRRFEIV